TEARAVLYLQAADEARRLYDRWICGCDGRMSRDGCQARRGADRNAAVCTRRDCGQFRDALEIDDAIGVATALAELGQQISAPGKRPGLPVAQSGGRDLDRRRAHIVEQLQVRAP